MQIGISSLHFQGLDLVDSARAAREAGFLWVELWYEQLRALAEPRSSLARRLRSTGIRWSIHADMRDLNLCSRNVEIRNESLRQVIETVHCAAELEASLVTVHPGKASATKGDRGEYFPWQVESLAAICAASSTCGVMVAIENMEPSPLALVTTWSDLQAILVRVESPALGVTLDVAHLYRLPPWEASSLVQKAAPLANVHVSGASESTAHLLLDEGSYDYATHLRSLASRYAGPVIVEGYQPGLGLAVMDRLLSAWRHLGLPAA